MVFIALISFLRSSCIGLSEPPTPLISQLHLPALLFFFPPFPLFFSLLLPLPSLPRSPSVTLSPPLSSVVDSSPSYLFRYPHPYPFKNVLYVVPRSHLVACAWIFVARFCLHYLLAHTLQLPSPRVPALPNISPPASGTTGACIIQRPLSMPRSSTFYPCTHTERYDRFIIYARCQS